MPITTASIENLHFDLENPRFSSLKDQRDALQRILDDQGEKLIRLARDIQAQGLNPSDLMIVLPDDHKNLIVLEGNRRLAALKLLSNPDLLNSLSVPQSRKNRYRELSSQFNRTDVEPIECAIVDSVEEANHWRELKHTGENSGAGIVAWDGMATARFRGKEASLQAIDFMRKHGSLDATTSHILETDFPITNLDRLLGDPYVRERLGLKKERSELATTYSRSEVIKGLSRVISDVAHHRITVSHIRNKHQRKSYIENFPPTDLPDPDETVSQWKLSEGPPRASETEKKTGRKSKRQPTIRRRLIPSNITLRIPEPRINTIYHELRSKISVKEAPNATAVLLRVFLELSIDWYIQDNNIQSVTNDANLQKKLQAVRDHMIQNKIATKDDLKPISVSIGNRDNLLAANTFNAYVHHMKMNPLPTELITTWDRMQDFFERIWP